MIPEDHTSSTSSTKKHIFLFRHCVRSVKDEINFHKQLRQSYYKKQEGEATLLNSSSVAPGTRDENNSNSSSTSTGVTGAESQQFDNGSRRVQRQQHPRVLLLLDKKDEYSCSTSTAKDKHEDSASATSLLCSSNPLDFISDLPVWNTPPQWCTLMGSDIMKGTGVDLFLRYILDDDEIINHDNGNIIRNNNGTSEEFEHDPSKNDDSCIHAADETDQLDKKVVEYKVKFLVDKSPRDIQTAYAMMDGMADIVKKHFDNKCLNKAKLVIKGLDAIEIEPRLFDPMKMNGFRHDGDSQNPICDSPPKTVENVQNIKQRYKNAPPPGNFSETLHWIQDRGGKNFMDFLVDEDELANNEPSLAEDASHFQGAFNLIKYVAEALFYSRASGIDFWESSASVEDIYSIMTWIHWSRYILSIGNNEAAAKGGVIMARILQELEHNNNHATFMIGHDGDIDAVATALGLSWNLPHPYHPGYSPTPPGSAIHFSYDGNKVEISFLAPILLNAQAPYLNSSGILEEVPVFFTSDFDQEITIRDNVTVLSSMASLRSRTLHVLGQYHSGALTCFHAAEKVWHQETQSISSQYESFYLGHVYIYFLLFFGCGILLGSFIFHSSHCSSGGGGGPSRLTTRQNIRGFLMFQKKKYDELKATQRTSSLSASNSESDLL